MRIAKGRLKQPANNAMPGGFFSNLQKPMPMPGPMPMPMPIQQPMPSFDLGRGTTSVGQTIPNPRRIDGGIPIPKNVPGGGGIDYGGGEGPPLTIGGPVLPPPGAVGPPPMPVVGGPVLPPPGAVQKLGGPNALPAPGSVVGGPVLPPPGAVQKLGGPNALPAPEMTTDQGISQTAPGGFPQRQGPRPILSVGVPGSQTYKEFPAPPINTTGEEHNLQNLPQPIGAPALGGTKEDIVPSVPGQDSMQNTYIGNYGLDRQNQGQKIDMDQFLAGSSVPPGGFPAPPTTGQGMPPVPGQGMPDMNLGSSYKLGGPNALPAPPTTGQGMPDPSQLMATGGNAGGDVAPTDTGSSPSYMQSENMPFASGIRQVSTGLDPLTEQLLFGIGGQGGFIPGAMRAAEQAFYDEEGNPIVIDEQVAGFSPDQIAAIEMQRQQLGLQDPYIQDARSALEASMQGYDPSITGQFFDPYEDQVVQQTIQDAMEQGAKSDIGALAGDIARGGQSAFGSRARLGAEERQRALGRGLAEAVSGIRSRGFSEAQRAGMSEFARQKAAQSAGASGLAGLGAQAAGASLSDIGALYGMGTQQQNQLQRLLDAERRNLQQYQMTPLMQYQALAPFISMAPAGQFQTVTDFAPRPSAMQAGLGTGLAAFGALGNFFNQGG
jgi:hypothetical protein